MLTHLFVLLFSTSLWAQNGAHGIFMVVKGDVKVQSGKDNKVEIAKVGKKAFAGDTIIAGPDSRAKVVMSDKNTLNISPDTRIKLERYENDPSKDLRNVQLSVEYGKVRASVEQKYDGEKNRFNVKTPAAVAGVRGTDFLTTFDKSTRQSTITTFQGVVAVGQPGPGGTIQSPVLVKPGEMTKASQGRPPEPPRSLPASELKQLNSESQADTAKDPGSAKGSNENSSKKKEGGEEETSDSKGEKSKGDAKDNKSENSDKKSEGSESGDKNSSEGKDKGPKKEPGDKGETSNDSKKGGDSKEARGADQASTDPKETRGADQAGTDSKETRGTDQAGADSNKGNQNTRNADKRSDTSGEKSQNGDSGKKGSVADSNRGRERDSSRRGGFDPRGSGDSSNGGGAGSMLPTTEPGGSARGPASLSPIGNMMGPGMGNMITNEDLTGGAIKGMQPVTAPTIPVFPVANVPVTTSPTQNITDVVRTITEIGKTGQKSRLHITIQK